MCISQAGLFSQFQERQWRVCFLGAKLCAGRNWTLALRLAAVLNLYVSFREICTEEARRTHETSAG
jgi:hypothetical protein